MPNIPGTNTPWPWDEGGFAGPPAGTAAAAAQASADQQSAVIAQRQADSDALVASIPPEYQAAVRQALTAVYTARDNVNKAASEPDQKTRAGLLKTALSDQQRAEAEYANILEKSASSATSRSHQAVDPDEKANWAAQADSHNAQAALARLRAQLAVEDDPAKQQNIQAQIEQRTATASLAQVRANIALAKSPADIERAVAQSQAAEALARQRNVLTPELAAEHHARTDELISRSKYYDARSVLTTAQIDQAEARGDLSAAEAANLRLLGPVKVADLQARTGLSQAKIQQIQANMNRWVALPAADRNSPTLVEQQPITGEVRGVPNPGYVNPEAQSIKDTYDAIDQVQSMLSQGQITPDDADTLMANLRTSLDARSRGFTPEQLQQNIQAQANYGKGVLSGMEQQGNTMSSQLLGAANRARDPSAFAGITPYTNAQDMGGGMDAMRQAFALMAQVRPITDRMSALDAVSKYGAASALLKAGGGGDQSSSGNNQPPADKPLLAAGAAGTAGDTSIGPTPPGSHAITPTADPRGPGLDWLFNSAASPIANPANTDDSQRLVSAARPF